jgi:hypothetical protein
LWYDQTFDDCLPYRVKSLFCQVFIISNIIICYYNNFLFVITAEILDIVIRHSDDINGFKYKNAEYKLSQYAYEIQIIIDGSEKTPLKLLLIYLMSFQR